MVIESNNQAIDAPAFLHAVHLGWSYAIINFTWNFSSIFIFVEEREIIYAGPSAIEATQHNHENNAVPEVLVKPEQNSGFVTRHLVCNHIKFRGYLLHNTHLLEV